MSGAPAKIATDKPTLRVGNAALPRLSFACMITSCNRSNAQFLSASEKARLGPPARQPAQNSRVRDWFRRLGSELPRATRGRKNHRQRQPGQDHGRAADRSGEGKNALAGEDVHRELGGKQDRACLHHEADHKKRARRGGRNPSVRGDRERSDCVQAGETARPAVRVRRRSRGRPRPPTPRQPRPSARPRQRE